MIIISHRGNLDSICPEFENRPDYIDTALKYYDVEIDLRVINNELYLGHDNPDYKIDINWLLERKNKLWIHCKNIEACLFLQKYKNELKYFWHTCDQISIISNHWLWCHKFDESLPYSSCILPLLSLDDIKNYQFSLPEAVCTDYPNYLKTYYENRKNKNS